MPKMTIAEALGHGFATRAEIDRAVNDGLLTVHDGADDGQIDVSELVEIFGQPFEHHEPATAESAIKEAADRITQLQLERDRLNAEVQRLRRDLAAAVSADPKNTSD